MKTYLNKNIDEINSALLSATGTGESVVHETENGTIITMRGLRTINSDFYSKEKNSGNLTYIGPNDKIYIQHN